MLWIWFFAFISFFIKGLCGFADAMVFTTLMSFTDSITYASPLMQVLGYPSNLIMIREHRKSVDLKICLPLCAMVIVGIIPGTLFFKNIDIGVLEIIFGLFVVGIALDMLLSKKKPVQAAQKPGWKMGLLGIIAGFVCGFCGLGVLIGAYISKVTSDTRAFKANACVVFFVASTIKIILFILLDMLTKELLLQALMLFPIALLGLWAGMKSSSIFNEARARKTVLIMLILSGLMLVINNL